LEDENTYLKRGKKFFLGEIFLLAKNTGIWYNRKNKKYLPPGRKMRNGILVYIVRSEKM